jgi:hypothetical protein
MILPLWVEPRCGEVGGAVGEDLRDGRLVDAEPAKTELQYAPAHLGAIVIAGSPLPFDSGPQRTLDGQGVGGGIDVGEPAELPAALELFDQRPLRLHRRHGPEKRK